MSGAMAGQKVGQYLIMEKIGAGSMARVYKAYQPSISRHVAIKILSPEFAAEANFVRRFENEAKAVAALDHPHILPIYDFGSQDDVIYMVMRLVEAGSLADLMKQPQVLANERIVKIISDIASALNYAHSKGIIHRNVNPNNILIDHHDEALLTDFGLAKVTQRYKARVTETGTIAETVNYMSPERLTDKRIGGQSDIYSLGVVLYELLTGQLPFQAKTPMATAIKHVKDPIPSLREINPNIPVALEQIVFKAMAKWSNQRYRTANEMGQALKMAL